MQIKTPLRSQNFAKLLTFQGKQVLALLQRSPDEKLVVVVQLWSDAADHQIRALIELERDDQAQLTFDNLTDETVGEFIEHSGLAGVLITRSNS